MRAHVVLERCAMMVTLASFICGDGHLKIDAFFLRNPGKRTQRTTTGLLTLADM